MQSSGYFEGKTESSEYEETFGRGETAKRKRILMGPQLGGESLGFWG